MRFSHFFKVILLLLFICSKATFAGTYNFSTKKNRISKTDSIKNPLRKNLNKNSIAIDPPKIKAVGNQTYCPQTYVKIATSVTITNDPTETSTNAVYIQIASGYVFGQDILTLTGSYPNIIFNWIPAEGKLILSSPTASLVPYSDFETAIKNVEFYNSSPSPSGIRNFSISLGTGQANYLPSNGHFYEYVPNLGITWSAAKLAAEAKTYYGLQGYLATITAADEAQLAGKQAPGAGWIGGSDAETEGIWKWVTGPESGTVFWNGATNGSTPNFAFWNAPNEPNNSGDEDYAHITAPGVGIPGSWNDLPDAGRPSGNYQPKGYIVEYDGMPGELPLQISASTTITIPIINTTTPASRCSSGTVTLQATASNGTVNWYDAPINGNLLTIGNTYTTPPLTTSTTYYLDAGCSTSRTPITATINTIPTITSTNSPVSRCGAGAVTLQATTDAGSINWYSSSTSTTIEATGTSFTLPNATTSTTYYAEAVNNGCTAVNRIPVSINIYSPPVVTDQEVTLCNSRTITLDASLSGMSYLWSTGETTQTITVSTPGTYTVAITSTALGNCSSTKKITVIEHDTPEIERVDINETTVVIYLKQEQVYFEYSVDGINYQSSNVFFNVPSGLQTAYVREINYCSYDTQNFLVLIVPKFFTPNNDNYNDLWEVEGLINYPEAEVTIFDRYGKFITQLNASKLTWDGTLNKSLLPASDYWYILKIDNTKPEMRGHFSLKR
jgi:gliding motility-associated-like protein